MKHLRKGIAVFTVICVLESTTVWSLPQGAITVFPEGETPAFFHVEIPQELASVEEIYEAPAKPEPNLILHIQNAHGNYESQVQIKKLLDYLYKSYGFKLLFVEGAVEKVDPEYLRLFPDKERNLEMADYLAKEGELTGAEFYMIDGPSDVEGVGIEEAALYHANYDAFKKVYAEKDEIANLRFQEEQKLDRLSSKTFSTDTRRVLSEWKKFQAGHREFMPFIKELVREADKFLELDLESVFAQVEWPQITRLLVIQSMEVDLDHAKAEKEKKDLLAFLKAQKASEELIAGVEMLGEKRIVMSRLEPSDNRLENLPRYLLERLVEEAGPKGFNFYDYPAFSLEAGHSILQSELDSKTLYDEIEILFDSILDKLAATGDQKKLLELYRDEELLDKLLKLELVRKDWQRAVERRDQIQPTSMANRIGDIERETSAAENKKALVGSGSSIPISPLIGEVFEAAFNFYEYARQRESVFYSTIQQKMAERKIEKAVLITGGFHTEGLMERFREAEINYGVLTPRLSEKVDNSNYVTTMMEDRKTVFDIANLEILNHMQSMAVRTQAGSSENMAAKRIVSAYLNLLINKEVANEEIQELLSYVSTSKFAQDRELNLEQVQQEAGTKQLVYQLSFSNRETFELIFNPTTDNKKFGLTVKRVNSYIPPPPPEEPQPAFVMPSTTTVAKAVESIPAKEFPGKVTVAQIGDIIATAGPLQTLQPVPEKDLSPVYPSDLDFRLDELFLGQNPRNVEIALTGRSEFRIAAVAGGILPEEIVAGHPETLGAFAQTIHDVIHPDRQADSNNPTFANAGTPSLSVEVVLNIPSESTLEAMGGLLANVYPKGAFTYVVVTTEKSLDRSEIGKIETFMKEQQKRKDITGREIGRRFNIVFTSGPTMPTLQKAFANLESALIAAGADRGLISNHSVLLIENGVKVDGSRFAARLLKSPEFKNQADLVVRGMITGRYAALLSAEELKELNSQLGAIFIQSNGEFNPEAFTANLVAALYRQIQAAAKREQSA